MKKFLFLLTILLCMNGTTAFAHDIEVENDDEVTYTLTVYANAQATTSRSLPNTGLPSARVT